ncbi:MAG: Leucyl aminopeptidase [Chloroflexi bacterium]|nr:Leucyl aminopeptidase [Chloroflexota bacterium]
MELRVATDQPWAVPADVLALPIAGVPVFDGPLGELDRRSGGELSALAAFGELSAKRYGATLAAAGELPAGRILAVGAGDADAIDRETVVHLGAAIVRRLAGRPVRRLAIWLEPLAGRLDGGAVAVAELLARGVVEGGYDPQQPYRAERDAAPPILDELVLVVPGAADTAAVSRAAARGQVMGEGANWARDLANRPANEATPQVLAEEARAVATRHDLFVDVIDEHRAAELGMGMFLAVGLGSDNPPRLIVIRSGAEGERDAAGRHLALVGKGVCFDSGGISLKPADKMEEMKMDKTGACTVIAAAATVARLAPGTPLLAVAPAVENMPGPHSARPGDVVRALNGRTVDIINTDAEGRLILGDALTYAERLGATHVVDVATLTGAVARAFGHLVSGAFGSPQAWYDEFAAAAARAGERVWQLPLEEDYFPEMESWYADMVNTGGAEAGLIKSALFLRRFVTVPWVHLDIAGTATFRKATPYAAKGATGVSHATLVELALAGAR